MKKYVLAILVASIFSPLIAYAQIPTTQAECNRRCTLAPLPQNLSERHAAKVKEIEAKKKEEKDPEKLKALQQEQDEENERHGDDREKICKAICRYNPVN